MLCDYFPNGVRVKRAAFQEAIAEQELLDQWPQLSAQPEPKSFVGLVTTYTQFRQDFQAGLAEQKGQPSSTDARSGIRVGYIQKRRLMTAENVGLNFLREFHF